MSLRFFTDHCVSNFVGDRLRDEGHEVLRLRDCIPQDSPDEIVIEKARELDAILVSLNGDFTDMIRYPPSTYEGIIALQVRNHPEVIPPLMDRLISFLKLTPQREYYKGKILLVEAHRIRVRG